MSNQDVKLTVTMDVTEAQALTLKAMFEEWESLSNMGSSKAVALYVDGDGDFHPNCEVTTDRPIRELSEEILDVARRSDDDLTVYDHDGVAWKIED